MVSVIQNYMMFIIQCVGGAVTQRLNIMLIMVAVV